jgi:hypothetical protein
MTEKALALWLADALTVQVEIGGGDLTELEQAAAELRRLHAENGELLKALDEIAINTHDDTAERVARAAIAKA